MLATALSACRACRAAGLALFSTRPARRPLPSHQRGAALAAPRGLPGASWVDGHCSPLPLTVALLLARHLGTGGGGMTPIELLRELGALWPGDERDCPTSLSYLRTFPALFVTEYQMRAKSRPFGLHPHCVRLAPAALALALAQAGSGAPPCASAAAAAAAAVSAAAASSPKPQGSAAAAAARAQLLAALPLQWLPLQTPSPCAATWGPLLVALLEREGLGPSHRLPLHHLLMRIQELALQHCLPIPPSSVHWFAMSPEPSFARLRPLWEEQVEGEACAGGGWAGGRAPPSPRLGKALRAVELVEPGRTALEVDLEALALLAEQCRARRSAPPAGAAAKGARR